MRLRDQTLSSVEVVLHSPDLVVFLGPNLVLEDCRVVSKMPGKHLTTAGVTMRGGTFKTARALVNFPFLRAHFERVAFSGTFSGCDFGDWDSPEIASISQCDFSGATLDGCRFLNCDFDTMVLPAWPGFSIAHPARARAYVLGQQWPKYLGFLVDAYTDTDPQCVGVCGDAQSLATKDGLSLDDVRALLAPIPGFRLAR